MNRPGVVQRLERVAYNRLMAGSIPPPRIRKCSTTQTINRRKNNV